MRIAGSVRFEKDDDDDRLRLPDLDVLLEPLKGLSEHELDKLGGVLDCEDSIESLRTAIEMLPSLLNPGRALGREFEASDLDTFLVSCYRLYALKMFLATPPGERMYMHNFVRWCRQRVEDAVIEGVLEEPKS